MSTSENSELLFVDTFTHANADDINLDLIQFSKVVIVHEIRVIPNGSKVTFSNSTIGTRIGSTTPTSFKLEMYVNNKTSNESTFQKLALLDYNENVEILTHVDKQVPTDGLIIKGWYESITVVVLGEVSKVDTIHFYQHHQQQHGGIIKSEVAFKNTQREYLPNDHQPSLHPSPSNNHDAIHKYPANPLLFPITGGQQDQMDGNPKAIPLEHVGVTKDPREVLADKSSEMSRKMDGVENEGDDDDTQKDSFQNLYFDDENDMGEAEATDEITDIYGTLSDGEIPETEPDYNQRVPDDSTLPFNKCLPSESQGEMDDDWGDAWVVSSSFNPCHFKLSPLHTIVDPSLTEYELEKTKLEGESKSGSEDDTRVVTQNEEDVLSIKKDVERVVELMREIESTSNLEKRFAWMEAVVEMTTPCLMARLLSQQADILDSLVAWCMQYLNLQTLAQSSCSLSLMKRLRGVLRLCGLLCGSDDVVAAKILSKGVQYALLDLLSTNHMPPSIRALILQCLHASIVTREGVRCFVEDCGVSGSGDGKHDVTPYQRMIRIVNGAKRDRCWSGMLRLLQKIHVREVLLLLRQQLIVLIDKASSLPGLLEGEEPKVEKPKEVEPKEEEVMEVEGKEDLIEKEKKEEVDLKDEMVVEGGVLCENDVEGGMEGDFDEVLSGIMQALTQVLNALKDFNKSQEDSIKFATTSKDDSLPHHPSTQQQLPTQQQKLSNQQHLSAQQDPTTQQQPHTPSDVVFFYRNLNDFKLTESLLLLLTCPVTCNHPCVYHLTTTILTTLSHSPHGLAYLATSINTTDAIIRVLCENSQECGTQGEDEKEAITQVGVSLACHLRTQHLMDLLRLHQIKQSAGDSALSTLLSLHSLTFLSQGRQALANVFTFHDNISALLPFIQNHHEHNIVEFNYAVCVLACVCRWSEKYAWMVVYGGEILKAVEEGAKLSRCEEQFTELKEWLSPVKALKSVVSADSATITGLVNLLTSLSSPSFSCVSVLRLLKHFTVEEVESCSASDYFEDSRTLSLTQKLLTADLHRSHCLSALSDLLKTMKEKSMLWWQLSIAQTKKDKWLAETVVKLVLIMIRHLVSRLVRARKSQLKDLSCITPILTIHSIFCSSLHNGQLPSHLQQIQDMTLDILLCFTRAFPQSLASQYEVDQSTWGGMLGELLTFILSSPCSFISGLVLLSELLPLPFPLQTSQPPPAETLTQTLLARQRWAAHLLTHSTTIASIISSLAPSSSETLMQLLRRVCWQVADLSTQTALLVVRSLLQALLQSMGVLPDENNNNNDVNYDDDDNNPDDNKVVVKKIELKKVVSECSQHTACILNLSSFLLKQPAIKAAFLSLFVEEDDGEYKDVIGCLCDLLNIVSDDPSHLLAQVSIAEIMNSLCDINISLLQPPPPQEDVNLATNLFPPTTLSLITTTIFTHLSHNEHKFASSLICLKTIALLFTHQYGYYHIKRCSKAGGRGFYSLLKRINATFSKDSLECVGTLSSTMHCLQMLASVPTDVDVDDDEGLFDVEEMRRLVHWPKKEYDISNHPLHHLNALLKEYAQEEEALQPVYANVNKVYELLLSTSPPNHACDTDQEELKLPVGVCLKGQMDARQLYEVIENEQDEEDDDEVNDKLTTAYWLSTPVGEEDAEGVQGKVDLVALAQECVPNLNLQQELRRSCVRSIEHDKNLLMKSSTETINTSKTKGSNNAFVAPLRGRGFMRGSGMMGGRDVFRSRPPNTSRPPSMHVDDFVKMETQHPPSTLIPIMPRKNEVDMRFERDDKMAPPTRYLQQFPQHEMGGMMMRGGYGRMIMGGRGTLRGTATGGLRRNYPLSVPINRSDGVMAAPGMPPMMDGRRASTAYHYNIPPYFEHKEHR